MGKLALATRPRNVKVEVTSQRSDIISHVGSNISELYCEAKGLKLKEKISGLRVETCYQIFRDKFYENLSIIYNFLLYYSLWVERFFTRRFLLTILIYNFSVFLPQNLEVFFIIA